MLVKNPTAILNGVFSDEINFTLQYRSQKLLFKLGSLNMCYISIKIIILLIKDYGDDLDTEELIFVLCQRIKFKAFQHKISQLQLCFSRRYSSTVTLNRNRQPPLSHRVEVSVLNDTLFYSINRNAASQKHFKIIINY